MLREQQSLQTWQVHGCHFLLISHLLDRSILGLSIGIMATVVVRQASCLECINQRTQLVSRLVALDAQRRCSALGRDRSRSDPLLREFSQFNASFESPDPHRKMIHTVTHLRAVPSQDLTIVLHAKEDSPSPLLQSSGFHSSSNSGLQMKIPMDFPAESTVDGGDAQFMMSVPRADSASSPLPELRVVKRPADSQLPAESVSLEKRKANHKIFELQDKLMRVEEESERKDDMITSLREDIMKQNKQLEMVKRDHTAERRKYVEEIQSLRYENAQLKVYTEEITTHRANPVSDEKAKLELEVVVLKQQLTSKDSENSHLKSKVDKLNEDYVRLSEDISIDPADSFRPRNVECTFRPISPPTDDHECFNPGYSETGCVSNVSVATTAAVFSRLVGTEKPALTKLEKNIQAIAEDRKRRDGPATHSSSWWSKTRSRKSSKWVEFSGLPGNHMDQCAATEHSGRLYVAVTTVGTPSRSHSPAPLPIISLYVLNDRERQFVNCNIPSPPDAVHPTGLFSHSGRMYLVTAQDGGDSVWHLDNQMKQWVFLSATINGETACASCMVDEHIILAGGIKKDSAKSSSNSVKSFSVSTMSWNHGWPVMASPRHAARLVHLHNALYIFSGGVGNNLVGYDTLHSVYCLSLSNVSTGWQKIAHMNELAPAVLSTGSRIVTAGGLRRKPVMEPISSAYTIEVLASGLEPDSLPSLNCKRSAATLVQYNNRLFCIGGCKEKGYCGAVEELVQE